MASTVASKKPSSSSDSARENAERQRRAHLPQNIVNKVTASPPKRSSSAEAFNRWKESKG